MTGWRLLLAAAVLLLGACGQDMDNQYKVEPYEPRSPVTGARILPLGTVARDDPLPGIAEPPPLSLALLERGRERFEIFCSPCHGDLGDGQGMIVQRGFPPPPTYHQPRLREAPDEHFYNVISEGYGVMYSYASRVPPADRWAIVAYIRALQFSQNAGLDALPAGMSAADLPAEARP